MHVDLLQALVLKRLQSGLFLLQGLLFLLLIHAAEGHASGGEG